MRARLASSSSGPSSPQGQTASVSATALVGIVLAAGLGAAPHASAGALPTVKVASNESSPSKPTGPEAPEDGVILQAFNWPFALVAERMRELAALGYTHVHVSPPSLSINRTEWWARYQPIDYRVIDGPLGNEDDFARMNQVAASLDIKIVADLVLNHMANPDFARYNVRYTDNPEQLYYPDPATRQRYGLSFLFGPEDFNPTGCIQNFDDRQQVLYDRLCLGFPDKGLPDLNLNRPNVVAAQRAYLQKLIALGVDGFRVDALKHIPPETITTIFADIDRSRILLFGEIIAHTGNLQREIGPYIDGTDLSFYDFPLVHLMRQAFQPGGSMAVLADPAGSGLALPGERAVTFIVNHDIPNNGDIFKYLLFHDREEERLAYSYILGRSQGLAYVYTDLGRQDGLDTDRFFDAYADPALVPMMGFRKAMAGQEEQILWASDQVLAWRRGNKGLVVVNKSGNDIFDLSQLKLDGLEDGLFRDVLSDRELTIAGGQPLTTLQNQVVGPRRATMFVRSEP